MNVRKLPVKWLILSMFLIIAIRLNKKHQRDSTSQGVKVMKQLLLVNAIDLSKMYELYAKSFTSKLYVNAV
jgi:hypothetical protein